MNYLYNGVELPDINEVWTDKETYPYAYIVDMTATVGFVAYQLTVANNVPYWTSSDGKVLFGWRYDGTLAKQYVYSPSIADFANNFTFAADHTVGNGMTLGLFDEERSISVPVWCNTDILNTDGTTYLAASEPIPVGSEPEKPTTFTPAPIPMTIGWLVGRRIAGQRGKYVEPDVPSGEPIAYLYNGVQMPELPELVGRSDCTNHFMAKVPVSFCSDEFPEIVGTPYESFPIYVLYSTTHPLVASVPPEGYEEYGEIKTQHNGLVGYQIDILIQSEELVAAANSIGYDFTVNEWHNLYGENVPDGLVLPFKPADVIDSWVWADYDVETYGYDYGYGEIYVAASEPVPVYE